MNASEESASRPLDPAGWSASRAFHEHLDKLYPDGRYDFHLEWCAYAVQHLTTDEATKWRAELVAKGEDADPLVIDLLDDKLAGKTVSSIPDLG